MVVRGPVLGDDPGLDERASRPGSSEKATTSAGRPDSTARDCSPELPYDWEIETPSPAGVFANAGISSAYASRGVEYAASASFDEPPLPPLASLVPPQEAASRATAASAAPITSLFIG